MTFTDAVYLAALLEAVLFFAAGYSLRGSKERSRIAASAPINQPEVGVEELIRELEREQAARRQHEQTIQHLQHTLGQLQAR
jgi:recombinational DNA repair ATPase RecF